jgi:hypothetical protein
VAGQVKLVDFGVAKWAAQRTETRHGVLKGKCAYMSPEQCRAEPLDRRSDVFSLGVLLYEITTGGRPFEGSNDFEVMTAIVRGVVVPPSARRPDYPPGLEPIVLRALAPARDERYPTAQVLARDLVAFAAREGLAPSAGGLAALLQTLFGAEAAGGTSQPEEDLEAPALTADPRPARPPLALDRTATDHQAPAAIQPLSLVEPVSEALRAVAARRIAIIAGVGLACIAAVAVAAPWLRKSPVAAPAAAATVVRAAAPVVPPAPVVAPAAMLPAEPPPLKEHDGDPPRRTKAARRSAPAPVTAPAPAAEKVKVWDPDSPLPPPP